MKRPFAVIGFSMLLVSLLTGYIDYKTTVALLVGVTVIFCLFLLFKRLRKHLNIIFIALAVMLYICSSLFAQNTYLKASEEYARKTDFTGVVCAEPQESDYAFTYIIKPQGENYKIRYVSEDNKMLREGDLVWGSVLLTDDEFKDNFFENSLSSKIYFTFFEGDEVFLDKTGEQNRFYASLGTVRAWFSNIIDKYLPGENGAIAKAMTIGDKSEISPYTMDTFNYSGTAHLLVISGLHLTLWSVGIVNFTSKFNGLRKHSVLIGLLCLLWYSALTGFSVSVIRAGAMIFTVLLGRTFSRGADSINSIGMALTGILIINPFATLSAALRFTTLSTLAILTVGNTLIRKYEDYSKNHKLLRKPFVSALVTTSIISLSTTVFTLPVFIREKGIAPVMSFISNIIMVDLALVLMVLTVTGALVHYIGATFIAEFFFTLIGLISRFLKEMAQLIGLWDFSTVSVSHRYFDYLITVLIISVIIACFFAKHRKILIKAFALILGTVFIVVSVYCGVYDYNTPSIDVICTDQMPILIGNYRGESVVVNPFSSKYDRQVKSALYTHNEKVIDNILVTKDEEITPSYLINVYDKFKVENTFFTYATPQIFESRSNGEVSSLTIGGAIKISGKNENYIEIFCKNKQVLVIEGENAENLFENIKDYDIIILYGKNVFEIKERLEAEGTKNQIYISEDYKNYSFYFKEKSYGTNL